MHTSAKFKGRAQFTKAGRPYTIAEKLGLARLEFYVFLTLDTQSFCYKSNNGAILYPLSVFGTVYQSRRTATRMRLRNLGFSKLLMYLRF